jgi:hypothetical protein
MERNRTATRNQDIKALKELLTKGVDLCEEFKLSKLIR